MDYPDEMIIYLRPGRCLRLVADDVVRIEIDDRVIWIHPKFLDGNWYWDRWFDV